MVQLGQRELVVASYSGVDMIGLVLGVQQYFNSVPPLIIFSGKFLEVPATGERFRKILSVHNDVLYLDKLGEDLSTEESSGALVKEISQVLGRFTSGIFRALIISNHDLTKLLVNELVDSEVLSENIPPGNGYGFGTNGKRVFIQNPVLSKKIIRVV